MSLLVLGLAVGGTYLVQPELFEDILPSSSKKETKKVEKKKAKKVAKKKAEKKSASATNTVQIVEEEEKKDATVEEKKKPVAKKEAVVEEDQDDFEGPDDDFEETSEETPDSEKKPVAGGDPVWTDCAGMKAAIEAEILKKVGSRKDADIVKFFQKSKNRLLLAKWVVADAELRSINGVEKASADREKQIKKLRSELETLRAKVPAKTKPSAALAWDINQKEKKLAKLESESRSAHLFSESAGDEEGKKLMEQISNNPDWLNDFAFSGECVRPGMALSILKKIHKEHPEMLEKRMVRDIATATALEYARSGWDQQDAVERAGFYINAWKDDRLNVVFDTIPMWQRRMVCGCKGDNAYGSIASLTWALDNFHLPADRFSGSCWRCSYRLNNIYGDSIHGPMYYAPFESELGENREAMTYHIGGVCGSLSHFGAFAALANGVPAMTSGEPGHCSFIVLVGDKWTPAYSLSWERGLHWQVFQNVYTYSSLHAATELYSNAQKKDTLKSDILRVMGGVYASAGKLDKAQHCYEKSAEAQPRNYMAIREWRETLEKSEGVKPEHWNKLNDVLCEKLVPIYPELAAEHMHKGLADDLAKNLDAKQLRKAYMKFWKSVKLMGPDRWRIEDLGDKQMAAMGVEGNAASLCEYFAEVLGVTVSKSEYAPAILNWGNLLSEKLDENGKTQLMQAIVKGIGRGGRMNAEDRVKLLAPAILAAETNRDLKSFQSIAKMVTGSGYKNKGISMPQFDAFPGKLASQGGLVWTSSTSQWDKPQEHAGLLTPEGGSFHTDKEEDAYVAVELPRQVNVTGIVIVCLNGNLGRCNNMLVQISDDGVEWTDVCDLGPCDERVMSTDLDGTKPVTKYVRILRQGGPEFFHLNGIYVYGTPAA